MSIAEHHQQLQQLLHVFLEENQKLNLSALRTEDDCYHGNVLDSLAALELRQVQALQQGSVLDIGTGGGFPLLPLAICLPNVQFTGLDSTKKKIDAIDRIAQKLSITNVQTICERTEIAGRDPEHREQYDIVTARALASLNVLLEYAVPFVKTDGYIIAWKSMNIDEELSASQHAQRALHCPLFDTHTYDLDETWGQRQLLIFQKTDPTSSKYPREVGTAKKNPL